MSTKVLTPTNCASCDTWRRSCVSSSADFGSWTPHSQKRRRREEKRGRDYLRAGTFDLQLLAEQYHWQSNQGGTTREQSEQYYSSHVHVFSTLLNTISMSILSLPVLSFQSRTDAAAVPRSYRALGWNSTSDSLFHCSMERPLQVCHIYTIH